MDQISENSNKEKIILESERNEDEAEIELSDDNVFQNISIGEHSM